MLIIIIIIIITIGKKAIADDSGENPLVKAFDITKANMEVSVPYLISDLDFLDCEQKVDLMSKG